MADPAADFVASLSTTELAELRALDHSALTERLKAAGFKKMGTRLKVEVLLQQGEAAGRGASKSEPADISDPASSALPTNAAASSPLVSSRSEHISIAAAAAAAAASSTSATAAAAAAPAASASVAGAADAASAEVAAAVKAAKFSSKSTFIPAESFAGKRTGYVFKMDSKGLGYYRDVGDADARLKGRMFGNMSWLTEEDFEADSAAKAPSQSEGLDPKEETPPSSSAAHAHANANAASPTHVTTTLALPGAAPRAPPEPGRLSAERKAILEKQAGEFAPELRDGKHADKGHIVRVNGKAWAMVKDIKCAQYEVQFFDDLGWTGGQTLHFSELQTTELTMKRWLLEKKKWEARAPLARKTLLDDKRGHVHKSWTGPSINELRLTDKSMPGKGYYAGVVPSVPVLMPPRIDASEVKEEGEGDGPNAGTKAKSGYYYAHRRKIDFKVPAPPKPI